MAKRVKRQARIVYHEEHDEFVVEMRCGEDKEWGYCVGYKCQMREHQEDGSPEYIHFSIINTINHLVDLGYQIVH